MQEPKLILGCSPGRCGSKSLSVLLDSQQDCICTHSCPVTGGPRMALSDLLIRECIYSADVAPWWAWCMPSIINSRPDTKFILLWRPINLILESMAHSRYIDLSPFAELKQCPERWIERYYLEFCNNAANYPDKIRFCKTESLSNRQYQMNLLSWCGFSDPVIIADLHFNKSDIIHE